MVPVTSRISKLRKPETVPMIVFRRRALTRLTSLCRPRLGLNTNRSSLLDLGHPGGQQVNYPGAAPDERLLAWTAGYVLVVAVTTLQAFKCAESQAWRKSHSHELILKWPPV